MSRHLGALLTIGLIVSMAGPAPAAAQQTTRLDEAEQLLRRLVETYGVSGAEGPVRDQVQSRLPGWATAETDSAGNLWVRVGKGGAPVVIVAHLDEIGFRISGIRDDGMLELTQRGGFFLSLFEGRPALVHTQDGPIPGVFTPRDSATLTRRPPGTPRVDLGTGSRAGTDALGVRVGQTVTMPKEYTRLAGTRATGRSFDDRVGCVALLLALRQLNPARLRRGDLRVERA